MLNMQIKSYNNTILVVDDSDSILEILSIGLKNRRYEVLATSSAEEALEIAYVQKFQFALLDIRLPNKSGIELGREIKIIDPRIVIILMTGYPEIDSALDALRNHVYDYLIKPLRVEQIISVIERAKREIRLIGENRYSAELIRTLKEENEQLKSLLNELIPDEMMFRSKSFNKFKSLPIGREDILRLYSRQKKNYIK
ncbi:MAG: response regulator [Candidatus Hatepunaea meridiana]|nr:response regulator [Candidatus Hatepunaea meridiana]